MSDSEFDLGKTLSKGDYKVIASQHIRRGNKQLLKSQFVHAESWTGEAFPRTPLGQMGKKILFLSF